MSDSFLERWEECLEFIKELDKERDKKRDSFEEFDHPCFKDMKSDEKILTHWITYVTDRLMKVKTTQKSKGLWAKALPVFASWVKYYTKTGNVEKLEKFWDQKNGFISIDRQKKFKSRFPKKDKDSILRTLNILKNYNRSLTSFIIVQTERFKNKEDLVSRIACCLFLLTYENRVKKEDLEELFIDSEKFEKYYEKWKKEKTQNKKRLWAAFRDYIKVGRIQRWVIESLKEHKRDDLITLWESFGRDFKFLNQLELPGDVWNKEPTFTKIFLVPLALELDIKSLKIENVSQVAREICDELNKRYNIKIYPEILDFTWDDELRSKFLTKFGNRKIKIKVENCEI